MAISLTSRSKPNVVKAVTQDVDSGVGANGALRFKDAGGTLLGVLTLPNPAFADPVSFVAVLNGTPLTVNGIALGTATQFDAVNTDGEAVYQGTVGLLGSGADAIVSDTAFDVDKPIQLYSHTITAP